MLLQRIKMINELNKKMFHLIYEQILKLKIFSYILKNPYKSVKCRTERDTERNPQLDRKIRTVSQKSGGILIGTVA